MKAIGGLNEKMDGSIEKELSSNGGSDFRTKNKYSQENKRVLENVISGRDDSSHFSYRDIDLIER